MEIQTSLKNDILTKAFTQLYPTKDVPKLKINFSGKFSDYNGNVKYERFGRTIIALNFSLSKKFKECEEEIRIGIVQELMNKVYKTKIETYEQDLYNKFVRHLTNYTKKKESSPILKELFEEINSEYFSNLLDEPTLRFGKISLRTLGNYNYNKDTVTISSVFLDGDKLKDRNLTKFVLYHELLHKKHKFKKVNNQNRHHTKEFKIDEKNYEDKDIEEKLKKFLLKYRIKEELNLFSNVKKKLKRFF